MVPTTIERTCTIYEVVYPDPRRRAAGETDDEAVSRAYFESPGAAASFRRHNGGEVVPLKVSASSKKALMNAGLLGHGTTRRGIR